MSAIQYKNNIDGKIGPSRQGTSGNCRMLSQLNGLSYTPWGAKAIKNAVQSDNQGGVYITFKGAKGGAKKFQITNQNLAQGYNYSKDDDDVKAFELASARYLKHIKALNYKDLATSRFDGNDVANLGENEFVGLLVGDEIESKNYCNFAYETVKEYQLTYKALDLILNNPGKYVAQVGFRINVPEFNIYTNHAYAIKRIDYVNGREVVILSGPENSGREIVVDKEIFECATLAITLYNKQDADKKNPLLDENSTYEEQSQFVKELTDGQKFLYMRENADRYIRHINAKHFGWGKCEERKKALIEPFIKAVKKEALRCKISNEEIKKFEDTCYAELNAKFYTNRGTIVKAFEHMTNLISEKDKI